MFKFLIGGGILFKVVLKIWGNFNNGVLILKVKFIIFFKYCLILGIFLSNLIKGFW